MTAPVFFDEHVRVLLNVGKLDEAARLILIATTDKEFGSGPPLDDLNKARRAWLAAYEKQRSAT